MNYPLDPWFPHPHYIIGIHDKDTLPPLFYVYCQNTAMAFDLRTYELVGIKRKGRNPKIVKHVLKKIKKWLNTIEPVFEPKTYGEHMRHSWSNDGMAITSDGQLLTVDEWKKVFLKETEEDNKNIDYSIPPIDTDGYIEPK